MPVTEEQCVQFWGLRTYRTITHYPTEQWTQTSQLKEQQRLQQQRRKENTFYIDNNLLETDRQHYNFLTTASDLTFWTKYYSWTYCDSCKMLIKNTMLPSYKNKTPLKTKRATSCIYLGGWVGNTTFVNEQTQKARY